MNEEIKDQLEKVLRENSLIPKYDIFDIQSEAQEALNAYIKIRDRLTSALELSSEITGAMVETYNSCRERYKETQTVAAQAIRTKDALDKAREAEETRNRYIAEFLAGD